jgi:hypothetical protein
VEKGNSKNAGAREKSSAGKADSSAGKLRRDARLKRIVTAVAASQGGGEFSRKLAVRCDRAALKPSSSRKSSHF